MWYASICNLHTRLKNIQNNNWEIWKHHHYHKKTVEIVKGSHTPVISFNFASHNASCFEDSKFQRSFVCLRVVVSKYQSEKYGRTQQNPLIQPPQILPPTVVLSWLWCGMHPLQSEQCTFLVPRLPRLVLRSFCVFKSYSTWWNNLDHTDTDGGNKRSTLRKREKEL